MKTKLTSKSKRITFQFRTDAIFLSHLNELATSDRISVSDVIRILVLREYAARFNGSGHPVATIAITDEPGSVPTKEEN